MTEASRRKDSIRIHRHEKRHGRVLKSLSSLSCAWARICKSQKPDHLLYTMEERYCIKCNRTHWFFLDRIEFEQPMIDPSQYYISELYEMGYFAQFEDANGDND